MKDYVIMAIMARMPKEYQVLRIVSVALDVLSNEITDNESRVTEKYGTELLEVIQTFEKRG